MFGVIDLKVKCPGIFADAWGAILEELGP